jgi:hypothetical protein
MMVRRPSTFGELISLRRTMERVSADPFFQMPVAREARRMPLDAFDTSDALVLEAALPAVETDARTTIAPDGTTATDA